MCDAAVFETLFPPDLHFDLSGLCVYEFNVQKFRK